MGEIQGAALTKVTRARKTRAALVNMMKEMLGRGESVWTIGWENFVCDGGLYIPPTRSIRTAAQTSLFFVPTIYTLPAQEVKPSSARYIMHHVGIQPELLTELDSRVIVGMLSCTVATVLMLMV